MFVKQEIEPLIIIRCHDSRPTAKYATSFTFDTIMSENCGMLIISLKRLKLFTIRNCFFKHIYLNKFPE